MYETLHQKPYWLLQDALKLIYSKVEQHTFPVVDTQNPARSIVYTGHGAGDSRNI